MSELWASPYFGIALSILAFWAGEKLQKKLKSPFCNPLLIAILIIVIILLVFDIPYDSYNEGGAVINMFLAPATACLAVSIYTKLQLLKENAIPILVGCTAGSLSSMGSVYVLCKLFGLDEAMTASLLPKSITTPIAVEVCQTHGGIVPVTVIAVIFTGILGSILGMAVGFVVFPTIIWQAYQTMVFRLPTFTLQFYPGMAVGSVLLSAAVIGITTWEACRASLREKTAALLLPRAPVAGKRIFLEYITPLWKHMSFSQKTTARNLFRYKKRFFMTVLGVAGCTALLLIGFGIQDSILPMLNRQTTELNHSDLTISYSDARAFSVEHGLGDVLDSSADVTSWGRFYNKSVTIYNANGDKQTVSIVTAEDESQMTAYFTFRTRQGHKAIPFDDSSAILTEKTAESLGLAVGDTFEVETSDGSRKTLTLTGITENYVFARLYLSQAQLRTLTGGTLPEWNTVYGQTDCPTSDDRNTLRTDLLACNYVSGVSFMEDTTEMFDNLIGCLNYVVILIIVCAAALAAVVLYNLISVNLGERKKELATIKVLGFFDNEVYRYIFREIDLLALIGSLTGLALGVPLHQFIVRTVEMDQMMFIRSIAPRSYLFSIALTLFFTVVVCRLMRRHVRNISMVESMKAPE